MILSDNLPENSVNKNWLHNLLPYKARLRQGHCWAHVLAFYAEFDIPCVRSWAPGSSVVLICFPPDVFPGHGMAVHGIHGITYRYVFLLDK